MIYEIDCTAKESKPTCFGLGLIIIMRISNVRENVALKELYNF